MILHKVTDERIAELPKELHDSMKGFLEILCTEYGENRNYMSEGGFLIILMDQEDYEVLKKFNIDLDNQVVEFTERVQTESETWIYSLIILNPDYAIVVYLEEDEAPQNLLDYVE
jgi:hypothetical protein